MMSEGGIDKIYSNPCDTMKIKITLSQALLILMKKYTHDEEKLKELKLMYLSGPKNLDQLNRYLHDPALVEYEVSSPPEFIDKDPVKRYGESRLAFEILKHNLGAMNSSLQSIYQMFMSAYSQENQDKLNVFFENLELTEDLFSNLDLPEHIIDSLMDLFGEFVEKIKSLNQNVHFTAAEKQVFNLCLRILILGVYNVFTMNEKLPMDIYPSHPMYSGKGRLTRSEQHEVRSNHHGLLKSFMPVPRSDPCFSDVTSSFLRPADKATFDIKQKWPKHAFDLLVHPYSNGVSGFMLAQLRFILLSRVSHPDYMGNREELIAFIRIISSALLYNSGGHTFYELIAPLSFKEIQENFPELQNSDPLDMPTILLEGNEEAFDQAIAATLLYHETYLLRMKLNQQISPDLKDRNQIIITILFQATLEIGDSFSEYNLDNYETLEWIIGQLQVLISDVEIDGTLTTDNILHMAKALFANAVHISQPNPITLFGHYEADKNSKLLVGCIKALENRVTESLRHVMEDFHRIDQAIQTTPALRGVL